MRKLIKVEPFDAAIHVFRGKKSFIKAFPEIEEDLLAAEGMCCEFKTPSGAPCFAMLLPKDYSSEVINHESLHLVHMLLDYHGITVDETMNSSELQCYMQSHVVREVENALYKRR